MKNISLFFLAILLFSGCGIKYSLSFSGIDLGKAETVSIKYFDNIAPIVNPDLSQVIYDGMVQRFVSQTPLDLVQRDGDLHFEGQITGYDVKPIDIQAGETAASNRLTVTVKVKFVNFTKPENNFEKSFSWYADYSNSQNLSDVESELIEEISEKIIDDIFNSSVVNW
ncbi:MAG: LptE family protein [Bacteroidales bacterium]|nr:LptE family protein [Bacteroidales bacterium]